jgi:hypothetical protein
MVRMLQPCLQEDTLDLLATAAPASDSQPQQEKQQQQEQAAPAQDQPYVQQQQPAGAPASSNVEQATAWQEEEGDDETEAGLPDGIVLVRICWYLSCGLLELGKVYVHGSWGHCCVSCDTAMSNAHAENKRIAAVPFEHKAAQRPAATQLRTFCYV